MLFNLDFPNNTNLSCLFFFSLIGNFYFLIFPVITKICDPIKLAIDIGVPTKEAKTEMETHPVTAEIEIRKSSI